jgi:hypothetical protein
VFEADHGLNPFDPGDAAGDADGDGYSNWDEMLMNSDPSRTNDPITVCVDSANTNGTWDGTQVHPFRSIQDAVESSVSINSNLAIRVRSGTYYEPVSNLRYDPYTGNLLSRRQFLHIYAANADWSLATDPESHVIDSLGFQHRDLLFFSGVASAPVVEFNGVTRARLNGFILRGGQGEFAGGVDCFSTQGVVTVSNCILENNGTLDTAAGGIYFEARTNSLIYNTVVAKNIGQVGGIFDVNGTRIWNCTIVSNVETYSGVAGVYGYLARPNVRNSIAWSTGLDLYFVDVDYSVFGSNELATAGAHNLTNDPQLVNGAFENYRLQMNSPVFSAGALLPIEERDLYGNSRPLTGSFDIGANQYTDSDADGMQNDWESKHQLNPNNGSDATGNPDGDGFNNLQEYNHNTDPHKSDTDGDGIPDDQDSDPTAPDLVLQTVFFDGYFESWFELYVNGVGHPEWINLPPTAPRPVVMTDRHIGDHINFQWRLLGSTGFDPAFLVFYVPHTTRGCIIPDLNAVPLNQIQFGTGDWAPPGGPWGFTIAESTPTNSDVCAGFDDETPKFFPGTLPALSVPQAGTNSFNVVINPTNVVGQILFRMTNTLTASVSPSSPASANQLVSVAGLATGSAIAINQFRVLGYGAQNTFTTICSRVDVDILPKRTNVTVAIYAVNATTTNVPPNDVPTATELTNYLDSVFGKQANVFMTVRPLTNVTVNYDLNGNGKLDYALGLSAEQKAITGAVYNAGLINVYYVRNLTGPLPLLTAGVSDRPSKTVYIQDFNLSSNVNITAHEIGHVLELEHPNNPGQRVTGNPDRLMWLGDTGHNPCRLVRPEWNTVNNKVLP